MMKIAFTSCNHPFKHPSQPGWLDIAAHQPDVLLMLGDNTYLEQHFWEIWVNKPVKRYTDDEFAHFLHGRYQQQWRVPQYQHLLQSIQNRRGQVLGTIDDHDFLGNDLYVTPDTQAKARIARLLHRQFIAASNNPVPAQYPACPDWRAQADDGFVQGVGCASQHRWGDVSVILLDNRSYREKPAETATVLGGRQLDWLQSHLSGSQRISLVCSGSPLMRGSKWMAPGSPLNAYKQEYARLRQLYRDHAHQCIVHMAGDVHYNDWRGRQIHTDFVEVCSSALGSGCLPFSPQANGNFGLIETGHQGLRIRTFGREPERNDDHWLSVVS